MVEINEHSQKVGRLQSDIAKFKDVQCVQSQPL